MYFVYSLKSCNHKYVYVGITENIERRLYQHNHGQNKSTKPYSPFFLLYYEKLPDRKAAREREIYLKSTSGKRFLYELLDNPRAGLPPEGRFEPPLGR